MVWVVVRLHMELEAVADVGLPCVAFLKYSQAQRKTGSQGSYSASDCLCLLKHNR